MIFILTPEKWNGAGADLLRRAEVVNALQRFVEVFLNLP
jgi:hypothetical protein